MAAAVVEGCDGDARDGREVSDTRIMAAGAAGVAAVVGLWRAGGVAAFPTETVYGLGADARREEAVRKIYEAKGRPPGNPVIVHVGDPGEAKLCAERWTALAEKLSDAFWPGPLTMILARGASITPLVSAGRETVALRCPRHPAALELLRAFGGPIAAPSANRSGFTSPTSAAHVLAELAGRIPLILDGGSSEIGLESTVVDISGDLPTVLRPGAVTLEMLRAAVGEVRVVDSTLQVTDVAESPGQHSRHYAPRTPAYRFTVAEWPQVKMWADLHAPVALLCHDDSIHLAAPSETMCMSADAGRYAQTFYAALREADGKNLAAILVQMPKDHGGLWAAIVDRIRRATEPFVVIMEAQR